ncbi:PaaX family transcriptional regulator C-terminal domain-containing protein [Arthrobacter sp. 7Tela_A1]|uniref:PaaX family transcriptional regulator C-terminal domain-containing protein n=1 Tax=Arthrobacter sp. 7Tela_A1 TaxID=3093745 RepID=UPI003BB67ED5
MRQISGFGSSRGDRFDNPLEGWADPDHQRAGKLSPAEAMRVRTGVVNVFRGFPRFDPDLPLGLLAEDWPRRPLGRPLRSFTTA